jgi:hypothetical protein
MVEMWTSIGKDLVEVADKLGIIQAVRAEARQPARPGAGQACRRDRGGVEDL